MQILLKGWTALGSAVLSTGLLWGQRCCGDRGAVGPIICRHGAQLYSDHSPGICSNVLSTAYYLREASLELSLETVAESLQGFPYMSFSVETLLRGRQVQPDEERAH